MFSGKAICLICQGILLSHFLLDLSSLLYSLLLIWQLKHLLFQELINFHSYLYLSINQEFFQIHYFGFTDINGIKLTRQDAPLLDLCCLEMKDQVLLEMGCGVGELIFL